MERRDERVIPSRRGPLLLQSLVVVALALAIGAALQSWRLLRSSPLGSVGDSLGFPAIAVIVAALGIWIAITLVRDSWNHRVVLRADGLTVSDSLGTYTVPYANLEKVESIPLGGVVIAFRDREQWLAQARGAADTRRRTSDVLRSSYGADVLISRKQLAVDAEEFIALVRQRAPQVIGEMRT